VALLPLNPIGISVEMLIFAEEGKPEKPEKNPRSKGENQQQTQLTYDTESENRSYMIITFLKIAYFTNSETK
jgi:hypothetical protein